MGPTGPTDPSQTSLGHCLGQGLAQAHPYPPGNKEVMGGLQGAVLGGRLLQAQKGVQGGQGLQMGLQLRLVKLNFRILLNLGAAMLLLPPMAKDLAPAPLRAPPNCPHLPHHPLQCPKLLEFHLGPLPCPSHIEETPLLNEDLIQ